MSAADTDPLYRRKPYRIFFPLGFALSLAGVFHWWLYGLRVTDSYHAVFHSIAQIQGFMLCFAIGFLFTAIPGRTGTDRPAPWQIAIGVIAPIGTTVTAWFEWFAASQVFWQVSGGESTFCDEGEHGHGRILNPVSLQAQAEAP